MEHNDPTKLLDWSVIGRDFLNCTSMMPHNKEHDLLRVPNVA